MTSAHTSPGVQESPAGSGNPVPDVSGLRVAIVHDYLTQTRGAERVVLAMLDAFPGARLYTSVYDPDQTFPAFRDHDVEVSWLNRVPLFRKDPRAALPLLPLVFSRWKIDADVVLASSSGWAHGVRTTAPKVVYCYNPARWLYQTQEYLHALPLSVKAAVKVLSPGLRKWDQRAAATASAYLTTSTVVRSRIQTAYDITAQIVPPPVSLDVRGPQAGVAGLAPGYFLVVGGARTYKNVDVLCEAFARMPEARLFVVGGLPQRDNGGAWPSNVSGQELVSDEQLRWLYENSVATLAASHEDFGLTPLEANAFGKPALVLEAGGFLDTLRPGISGLFIERLEVASVMALVRAFDPTAFDARQIRDHAATYGENRFTAALRQAVLEHARPPSRAVHPTNSP